MRAHPSPSAPCASQDGSLTAPQALSPGSRRPFSQAAPPACPLHAFSPGARAPATASAGLVDWPSLSAPSRTCSLHCPGPGPTPAPTPLPPPAPPLASVSSSFLCCADSGPREGTEATWKAGPLSGFCLPASDKSAPDKGRTSCSHRVCPLSSLPWGPLMLPAAQRRFLRRRTGTTLDHTEKRQQTQIQRGAPRK